MTVSNKEYNRVVEALKKVEEIAYGRDRLDGFPRSRDEKQRRLSAIFGVTHDALQDVPAAVPQAPDGVDQSYPAMENYEDDYRSHHGDWRKACGIARDAAADEADRSYWQHQVDVLDRIEQHRTPTP